MSPMMLRAIRKVRDMVEGQGVPWDVAVRDVLRKTTNLGLCERSDLEEGARKKYGAAQ